MKIDRTNPENESIEIELLDFLEKLGIKAAKPKDVNDRFRRSLLRPIKVCSSWFFPEEEVNDI